MADGDGNPHEIFWTREERSYNKDSDGYLHSFVPGVDQPGNIKVTRKMKFHQSNDMLNKAMKASGDERLMKERTNTESRVENHDRRKDKDIHKSKTSSVEAPRLKDKPSLKDLKPEDKKRIANLIRELAKAGEEKEVIVQQLSVERRSYEDKVNKLHEQMAAIIQERELTQKQYLECQKLLAEYQSQLASEQEKLALSLHHRASPPKFGMAPQSPTKPAPDYAPVVKKNQSNTPHKERQLRTLRVTDHQTTSQHATLTQSNGYNNAPHTGYRYPVTHQSSLVQDYQVPDIHQTSSWNQPAGTHQHSVPRTQLSHPNIIGTEFNPLLASTHRSQQVHSGNTSWTEPQVRVLASKSEPAMYVSYGTNRNPQGYMFQPGLDPEHRIHLPQSGPSSSYPKDSQEMFGSRPQSGEFRPLQPELETDFESRDCKSPQYVAAFWNHQNGAPDGLQGNTQRDKIGSNNHHHGEISEIPHAVTRQPAYQATGLPEQCHAVLERQRHELRQEQAWLRQKLKDQEKILLQKQNQLELHRLRQLEQEGQRHSTSSHMEREWLDHGSGTVATSHPQKNVKDLEWEEPNIYSGMQHEVPSGSENDSDEVISTNYPPESFMNQSTSKEALETSMRRLHVSPRSRNPCGTDMSNARVAIATENPSQRTRGIKIDGYASLYPNSQPRNKIHVQGSMSSYSPSTSSSGMSQARMVNRSTSPLYKDHKTETARSPGKGGLSLSPGKVHITPAPAAHTNREPIQMQHRRRRAVSLPQSPRYHSGITKEKKRQILNPQVHWFFYGVESPQMMTFWDPNIAEIQYHHSITYHSEADLQLPYGKYLSNHSDEMVSPERDWSANKTALIAWMASNCNNTFWPRHEFVSELKKHILVDMYGACGTLTCLPALSEKCTNLMTRYKFYLALENAECDDYITEKVWTNGLLQGAVPVVYGGRKESYERLLPPKSFIHISDFDSAEQLAAYLQFLHFHKSMYNMYHAWRNYGSFKVVYPPLNPQFFCEIVPFTLKPPPQLRAVKNSGYYKGCKSLLGTFVDRGSLKSFVPWK